MQVDGYTINYDTVSIVEYIRFASKICNVNFIYNEEELQFNVSVISEDPITPDNVMATLLQMLRVHGLTLLEQDNNLVIHKNDGVRQMATLVSEAGEATNAPIVTRIFHLKNAKPDSIAAIIRPMLSSESILEVSMDTRQVILTDVTANVNKVAALIENLDSPHTPLEIRSYEAKFNNPEYLIDISSQIMNPIAAGNPFILVPQKLANAIYIVSTPALAEKAASVLAHLDSPPKKEVLAGQKLRSENIFVYKVEHRSGNDIIKGLQRIANNLQQTGFPETDLIATIDSVKWIPETNTLMFYGNKDALEKVKEFLHALDVPGKIAEKSSFFLYTPHNKSAKEVADAIKEMADNLKGAPGTDASLLATLDSVKVNPSTNSVVFSGEEKDFPQIREMLATIDMPSPKHAVVPKKGFYVYKIQHVPPSEIESSLKTFAKTLDSTHTDSNGLIETIYSMKYIKETNSLMFTGPEKALDRLKGILPSFDAGHAHEKVSSQFLIYKPKFVSGDRVLKQMREIEDNLRDSKLANPELLNALASMKYVKSTNSLLFTGDPESLARIDDLIKTVDIPTGKPREERTFFLYQPKFASKEKTEAYIQQLGQNLDKRQDEDLLETIHSMKWIAPSKSFMFQGDQHSITRLKELLTTFDTKDQKEPSKQHFFLFEPKFASKEKVNNYLTEVSHNLRKKGGNDQLVQVINSRKWIEESDSFMFSGDKPTLEQVKDLLEKFDTEDEKTTKPGYYLYKLQNVSGEVVEEDLDNLAKNFKSSGLKDQRILEVIKNIRYVKETNSLLLTGNPQAIEEVKNLIAQYDIPRKEKVEPIKSNFYMYKPKHVSASELEKSLKEVGNNLKKAGLADPSLISTIGSIKYVSSTNSLIFTGPPEALEKIQGLIKDIDIPAQKHAPIQKIGKTTFLIYKLKNATGENITSSIRHITSDLKRSGTSDKQFIDALKSMKYVQETDSLMFTGTPEALAKVEMLVEKFDVKSLGAPPKKIVIKPKTTGDNFLVYKPQSLTGPELEKLMEDFSENLKMSGLSDPQLFKAIDSMRYVGRSQSLIFTGNEKALTRIKELLASFDIPSNLPEGPSPHGPLEPSIQAIDNTSFLVYKLQFHKGDEIQGALRQIAKDLILNNAPVNQNLLNSINSIQWLEVTNSLLCSGDQETLTRLRELIKNLDIPLKQVFIEMLVIETNLTNALNFGLEWGAKYKYRNKFSGSSGNFAPPAAGEAFSDSFASGISGTSATTTPVPSDIPFSGNFSLGVIGEVIKHNGQTFLTLGSLLTALQQDQESSVVLTPKLIMQDGKTSNLFVGQNIPFVGSLVSQSGPNTVQTANFEYRNIGFNLTITPVLGNSDVVTLDIQLDSSSQATDVSGSQVTVGGTTQVTATGITTNQTTMSTTVHVPDNNFLILSGMVNNSNVKVKTGIPCLGGLPFIGAAFSTDSDTLANSNIVIFLRPHIITSLDDMRKVTENQEEYFRDQAGTPFLEHNYDDSMELIKTVDDE